MRRHVIATLLALSAAHATAEVKFRDGKVWFNGERQEQVWGRSCFKLANHLTYHYTGNGGGVWGLGSAEAWVRWHMESEPFEYRGETIRPLGLPEGFVCRVFMETAGWDENCEPEALSNNGKPEQCMFGSEPVDKGAWNVQQLRGGGRPDRVHPVAAKAYEWFFQASEKHGMAFELVTIATLKHDNVSVGQQTHVVRQATALMARLQRKYPRANVIDTKINEWNAHSRWTVADVNMLATRSDRCKHPDGRTKLSKTFTWRQIDGEWEADCGDGFLGEQWPGGPQIVDGGGNDRFAFDVGPDPGKYRMGVVHPSRHGPRALAVSILENAVLASDFVEDNVYYPHNSGDRGNEDADDPPDNVIAATTWDAFPDAADIRELRRDSRGMPIASNESMYYVEPEDRERASSWYRPSGWTSAWQLYKGFLDHNLAARSVDVDGLDYFIVHDEKGAQSTVGWPRAETRVDRWLRQNLGCANECSEEPDPEPDPSPDPEPDPDPPPIDLGLLARLLAMLGLDIDPEALVELVGRVERELAARGRQLDRIEANQATILARLAELELPVAEPEPEPEPEPDPEPEYMPAWDDIKDEIFGRAPHRTATYRKALMSIDQQLIWDGVRNPNFALGIGDYPWPYKRDEQFPAVDQERARWIARTAQGLLDRLRHFVEFDPRDNRAVATGGRWLDGRVRVESFESWHRDFAALYQWLEAANGISRP